MAPRLVLCVARRPAREKLTQPHFERMHTRGHSFIGVASRHCACFLRATCPRVPVDALAGLQIEMVRLFSVRLTRPFSPAVTPGGNDRGMGCRLLPILTPFRVNPTHLPVGCTRFFRTPPLERYYLYFYVKRMAFWFVQTIL